VRIELKGNMKRLAIYLVILWLACTGVAMGAITDIRPGNQPVLGRETNVFRILTVFENKIEDRQLLEKTKKKLLTLSDGQTRLIASLSDRVTQEGNSAGASIAFLLMTVLITLL
jgi:hypothetical protein